MLTKPNDGIISKNLKPNVCTYRKPLPARKIVAAKPVKEQEELFADVLIEELSQNLIVADNKRNLSNVDFATKLDISCLSKVSAPKPDRYLDNFTFAFKVEINTGKHLHSLIINVKGDRVLHDGSKLTDHILRRSNRKSCVYDFNYNTLCPVLTADIAAASVSGDIKLSKALRKLQKQENTLGV